jgi:hypothetical protein
VGATVGAGVGTGVLVAGAGVAVGAFVGATVLVGETRGDDVGAAVVTCAGAWVTGAGVGLAGVVVPPGAAGAEACDSGVATGAAGETLSDGLACGIAGVPLFAVSATSRIAVKAASARPMASAGPSTRYRANEVRTGRSLMASHFESRPTPTRHNAHSCES